MVFNTDKVKQQFSQQSSDTVEEVVLINRISKKTQGGNKVSFSALVVVGDKKGNVGAAHAKAADVAAAIRKSVVAAKKHMVNVPTVNGTIPFNVTVKLGAARVMLKPAPQGSGIIAGGAVRSVVAAAGIRNISSKVLGSGNKASNVYATLEALSQIATMYKANTAKNPKKVSGQEGEKNA